jgi:hypothetical protein
MPARNIQVVKNVSLTILVAGALCLLFTWTVPLDPVALANPRTQHALLLDTKLGLAPSTSKTTSAMDTSATINSPVYLRGHRGVVFLLQNVSRNVFLQRTIATKPRINATKLSLGMEPTYAIANFNAMEP